MSRSKRVTIFVLTFILILLASTALAAYGNGSKYTMYCDRCNARKVGTLSYVGQKERTYGTCQKTANCTIKSVYKMFDWHCDTCGYGGGAHGIEQEVKRYHTNSSCPIGSITINSIPVVVY
ncbi:MAG: hypothetical protein PUE18_04420 [Firmicutes bacterium]|nr:hypothetical protein [Bacillota bacterium]